MKNTVLATVILAVSVLALAGCGSMHKSYDGAPYNGRTAGKGVAVYDSKGNRTYTKAQTK